MKIYLDESFRCHLSPGEGLTEAETDLFEGKAPEAVAGYRFIPAGKSWVREDGRVFRGEMAAPWKPWAELDSIQRAYERARNEELTAAMAEMVEEVYRRDMEEME